MRGCVFIGPEILPRILEINEPFVSAFGHEAGLDFAQHLGGNMNAKHIAIAGLILLCSSLAQALNANEMSLLSLNDPAITSRCRSLYNPYDCQNVRGCYWDRQNRQCESVYHDDDDDYDNDRSCSYIRSPLECSNRYNCYWSRRLNRCVSTDGGGGGGGDYPRRCYYIRSPYECDATYNCHWSHAYDRCVGPDDF